MKKALHVYIGISLMLGCSDGPEIIPCVVPALNDIACVEIYEPVCGCNDVTYSNYCYAEVGGVTSWTEGECLD